MGIELSKEVMSLLDRPNFAHLATLMSDGSPQSVPVWIGREDDQVLICTAEGSLKARNTLRDPRVALSVVDFHNPYEEVRLRGWIQFGVQDPVCVDSYRLLLPRFDTFHGRRRPRQQE